MNLLIVFPISNNYFSVYFVSLVLGYILGSIPFGFIVARLRGVDIRSTGSKNIGFTNVNRIMGSTLAIPVLIFDIAKGFLPTFFASRLGLIPAIVGLGAVLGHIFTPWLSFKGGKGVATAIGVMSALTPIALAGGVVILLIILLSFSFMSLASLSFAVSLPILVFFLYREQKFVLILTILIAILIIIRHKTNIIKLVQKTESKTSFLKLRKN